MKKILSLITLSIAFLTFYAQTQISNFTYNDIQNSSPGGFLTFGGKIFFSAANDGLGRELWSSDGTSSNTKLVVDIEQGTANGLNVFYSTMTNNELFFSANDSNNYSGGDIWKTDGTTTGSSFVTSYDGRLIGLTAAGNQVFFTIKPNDTTFQIWKTDGTGPGTAIVKDSIYLWSFPSFQGSVNGKFIFTIKVPFSNYSKVWRSDGTEAGTYELTSIIDGNGATGSTSDLTQYINHNNKLYFISRRFLHETDGTVSGTKQVAPVWNAQNDLVSFDDAIVLNNKLYILFFSKRLKKISIYESDWTSSGTSEIFSATSSQYFYPSYLNSSGDNLMFSSVNANGGTSLFYLDSNTHLATEKIELTKAPQEPFTFQGHLSALFLDKINSDCFFVSSPKDNWPERKGWIFYEASSTLTPVEILDNQFPGNAARIVYNDELYYSSDFQLWKLNTKSLSISPLNNNLKTQVYPNPVPEFIYFSGSSQITQLKIYDLAGKLVSEEGKIISNKVDLRNLPSKTYIIKFLDNDGRAGNRKIIKK